MRKQSNLKETLSGLMEGASDASPSNPIVRDLQKVAAALRNARPATVSYHDLNRVKAALYDKR